MGSHGAFSTGASVDGGQRDQTRGGLPSETVVTVPEPFHAGPRADCGPEPLSGDGSVPPAGADSESVFDDLLAALSKSSDTSSETIPPLPSFESLFEAEEPEGPAPAVVAVMVAHNPGVWFEETLSSLGAQDYSALSVLVIDAASRDGVELRDRVGAVLPDAHLRRLPENSGYAAAANEALAAVQGAAFYLFCHDDVRLDPDAVRLLVEEAFRSNAGIVGPKIVEWSDPRRLLSVGMGADRFGHPAAYVERGDLDQEQHDAVRDVFFIPGAVTLIRADLFEALGGFDSAISFHGEDLELCWRAHAAGACDRCSCGTCCPSRGARYSPSRRRSSTAPGPTSIASDAQFGHPRYSCAGNPGSVCSFSVGNRPSNCAGPLPSGTRHLVRMDMEFAKFVLGPNTTSITRCHPACS